jgi:glyoxylase-like metal-dependent hydrolase (beta-lactamase superfamily II)
MTDVPYTRGLHKLTEHCYAWLLPDGAWGWSNVGLVTGGSESLLVDTLFDLAMTREMLDGLRPVTGTHPITTVVNTHANGDHWFGNELVAGAEIIASRETAAEMATNGPDLVTALLKLDGPVGRFGRHIFAPFDFSGITPTPATRTFSQELTVEAGGTQVRIIKLGPAHTEGDSIVFVPAEGVLYAGDLVFIGGTPITWAGPVSNWIRACRYMLDCDAAYIVPGHGPVTDNDGVRAVMDYLEFVQHEAGERHARGMGAEEAMRDISLGRFAELGERSRIAQNVLAVYYELDPTMERVDLLEVFRRMGALEGFNLSKTQHNPQHQDLSTGLGLVLGLDVGDGCRSRCPERRSTPPARSRCSRCYRCVLRRLACMSRLRTWVESGPKVSAMRGRTAQSPASASLPHPTSA